MRKAAPSKPSRPVRLEDEVEGRLVEECRSSDAGLMFRVVPVDARQADKWISEASLAPGERTRWDATIKHRRLLVRDPFPLTRRQDGKEKGAIFPCPMICKMFHY